MTRVKVCGLTAAADLDAAIEAGADAVGFLVDVPVETARELHPASANELIEDVPPFVTTVLVTMPDSAERALELLELTGADAVQLHNDLPLTSVEAVAEGTDATVMKAVDADPVAAARYAPAVDGLVVDSRTADGAGGTGRRPDWERAAAVRGKVDVPLVLAGGLTPDNVVEGIEAVEPYAVDVSSGVERAEGHKDHDAVRAFVAAATGLPLAP